MHTIFQTGAIPESAYKPESDSPAPPSSLYVTSPMNDREIGMRILSRMNLPYLNTGFHFGLPSPGTAFHPPYTNDTRPSI